MNRRLKTNEDLVLDLMNYSPYGALGEVFIVEAIRKYADALVATPLGPSSPDSFINNEPWNSIAADVKKRCDEFYGWEKTQ